MWINFLLSLFFALTGGVLQEFTLYNNSTARDGNSFLLREHLPDASCSLLANVTRLCSNSYIFGYSQVNFGVSRGIFGAACYAVPNFNADSNYKSLRFTGNSDTEVDGVSLYPLTRLVGEEIYIDHSPFSLFATNVKISYIGWTGPSIWTLFEGVNFDGKQVCLPGTRVTGKSAYFHNITQGLALGLSTIGSLVKGCLTQVTPAMQADLRRQARAAQPWN